MLASIHYDIDLDHIALDTKSGQTLLLVASGAEVLQSKHRAFAPMDMRDLRVVGNPRTVATSVSIICTSVRYYRQVGTWG